MSKLQNMLSSLMLGAGKGVEKVASLFQGKTVKPKRTGVEDTQGHDFGYIEWNEKQIHSLLTAAERKQLLPLIPPLETKRALHLTPGKENYVAPMAKRGAQNLIEMDVSRHPGGALGVTGSHLKVRGGVDRFPFPEDSFDFILYPSALAWRADLPALFPESARCIAENGRLLLSIVHPFFEYLMNPRSGFKKSVETIFENLKKNHFLIEELKEGSLEEAMRSVSLPPKTQKDLQRFAGLPLILVIKGIRLRKKRVQ